MAERSLSRYRDGSEYVLTVDLPGIPPEDLEVTWDDGRLHVVAEHAGEGRTEAFHELATFSREIDPGGIAATYESGTLAVRLPIRKEGPRGMSVPIESVGGEPEEAEVEDPERTREFEGNGDVEGDPDGSEAGRTPEAGE